MKKIIFSLTIVFSLILQNHTSFAQTSDLGFHTHDGFYLSMSTGFNAVSISDKMDGKTIDFSGLGGIFDFKIGGALNSNLILHATLTSNSLVGPTMRLDEKEDKASNEVALGEAMIGGGFTYYYPSNFFISSSLGIGNFTMIDGINKTAVSTPRGFSMQLKLGKEWWVSKNWGLGIGFTYSKTALSMTTSGITERLNSNNFGILFNTTFN